MKQGRRASWILLVLCSAASVALAQPVECTPELILASSIADTIFVDHINATKNCCTTLTIDVAVEGFVVDFVEGDAGDWCTCMCCFNLAYEAHGFAAGHYTVRVWYNDLMVGETEVDVEGTEGALAVGSVAKGSCLEPGTVEGPETRIASWGRIRTHYRS
jgi:hypothetical protein